MTAAIAVDDPWGLSELLKKFTSLVVRPTAQSMLRIVGDLEFSAKPKALEQITDAYQISLEVPERFPRSLPRVWESGGRIPEDFHKLSDGALCLGSPFRQHVVIAKRPTLLGFVEECVVPYLYGYTYFAKHGIMPFNELDHITGLIDDYRSAFRVRTPAACLEMLRLLGMKRRIANKQPCPCRSGRRLGRCHHKILNPLRSIQTRQWYLRQRDMFIRSGVN